MPSVAGTSKHSQNKWSSLQRQALQPDSDVLMPSTPFQPHPCVKVGQRELGSCTDKENIQLEEGKASTPFPQEPLKAEERKDISHYRG